MDNGPLKSQTQPCIINLLFFCVYTCVLKARIAGEIVPQTAPLLLFGECLYGLHEAIGSLGRLRSSHIPSLYSISAAFYGDRREYSSCGDANCQFQFRVTGRTLIRRRSRNQLPNLICIEMQLDTSIWRSRLELKKLRHASGSFSSTTPTRVKLMSLRIVYV
jgi:hypothetical protein